MRQPKRFVNGCGCCGFPLKEGADFCDPCLQHVAPWQVGVPLWNRTYEAQHDQKCPFDEAEAVRKAQLEGHADECPGCRPWLGAFPHMQAGTKTRPTKLKPPPPPALEAVELAQITSCQLGEEAGEKRLIIFAKVTGDAELLVKELNDHGLTLFLERERAGC